jgi:hypothetical protein
MATMQTRSDDLSQLILKQLAGGEKRLLVLVVGIRKSSGGLPFKGDLSARVQSALRSLVSSKAIVNTDGIYSLCTIRGSLS